MCDCSSCLHTARVGVKGFNFTPSESDIARYQNAKQFSKVPKDPIYTTHFGHCHPIPAKPVARPKRGQPMRFKDHGTRFSPESVILPAYGWQTTAEYIQGFDERNSLKSVEYSFYWGQTDMRSEQIAA